MIRINLDELTLNDAQGWIDPPEDYDENLNFWNGDHWQKGKGWVGPMPDHSGKDLRKPGNKDEMYRRVRRAFVSQNVIREVVERHVGGVMGQAPDFSFTPTVPDDNPDEQTAEEEAADEVTRRLSDWFDRRNAHVMLLRAANHILLGETAGIRLAIPESMVEDEAEDAEEAETFRLPSLDFEEALDNIFPDLVTPDEGAVETDRRTMREFAIFKNPDDSFAELSYVNDEGQTVLATLDDEGLTASDGMDLNGNLLMHMGERPLFVTEQVRQQQKTLNKVFTMMSVNLDWSGFLERIFLNTQRPVRKKTDSQGNPVRDSEGNVQYEPTDYKTGPGSTFFAAGVTTTDKEGNTTVANPSVTFRDPVSPETFRESKEMTYEALLSEVRQLHALITGDSTPSGESRRQAMADFIVSLLFTKITLQRLGRWLIETTFLFARAMSNGGSPVSGDYDMRVSFTCHIDVGPVTIQEAQWLMDAVEKRVMSRRTALSRMGVQNIDAELDEIRTDLYAQTTLSAEQAKIVVDATNSGMDLQNALQFAGLDEEEAQELVSVEGPPPVEQ